MDGRSAEQIFAGFGAGLVMPAGDGSMDAAGLYTLCDIVSVGAAAFCPEIPWIRQYFADSVYYYPPDEPATAAKAIRHILEEICYDPATAAARAEAARSVFEERFAAEIMLQNAAGVLEEWHASRMPPVTQADHAAISKTLEAIEPVFARLPPKTLAEVGQA